MKCYRDMTFCATWAICKKGHDCHRALTPQIREGADKVKLPIAQFGELPDCFVPFFKPTWEVRG